MLVVLFSLMGTGVLAEPWNEFEVWVQEYGWAQKDIEFPLSQASLDIRIYTEPITGENFINSCVFHSDQDITSGSGLSSGKAICKLLDINGNAIAEGRTTFDSYMGSDDLEIFITSFVFPNSNLNDNIFDIKFIIEGPI